MFGLLAILIPAPAVDAEIKVTGRPSVAVQGADLVVPLISTDGLDEWPAVIPVEVDGETRMASVAWIVPRPVSEPAWTTPVSPVTIIRAAEGVGAPVRGSAIAIFPTPLDGEGEVAMLGERWTPRWLPPIDLFDPSRGQIESKGSDADPPLEDPMDWFRWAVLAYLEDGRPPLPRLGGGEDADLGCRVAVSIACQWRAGLRRVESSSPGVAREIAERLVARVIDERRPTGDRLVAAWPTDPRELTGLRTLLLDPGRTPLQSARAGLAWFEARPPFLAWATETGGSSVTVELANPTLGELVVLASWGDGADEAEAVVLPPSTLVSRVIDRPSLAAGTMPPREILDFVVDRRKRRLTFEERAIPVRPPGGSFGSMALPLGLAAANGDYVEVPPVQLGTGAILRRRGTTWQIFIDARTVEHSDDDRIYLVFGPSEDSRARLEVRSNGVFESSTALGSSGLAVRVRRHVDRWRAEIDVPESWLANSIADSEAGAVLIGLRRDGPAPLVSFAGPPPPAWRRRIPVRPFAIADWDRPAPPMSGEDR